MKPVAIDKGIFWVGVNDEKTELFEGLWLIREEGISYNSFLIKDKKNVLVDLCKDFYSTNYLAALRTIIDPSEINYLVINHMEPDHSGSLIEFRKIAPQAVILTTQKSVKMLADFYSISNHIQVVSDGERISLGEHTLRFISAPMVHWPETMMTFEEKTGILFSCDAFGGFGKLTDGIFDSDYKDLTFFENESLRYFANIVAAFSKPVLKAGEKLTEMDIRIVAPSHGLVWKKDPYRILSHYLKWSGYSKGTAEIAVTLLTGSMYGNTERIADSVEKGLNAAGIPIDRFDITRTHISYILPAVWKNQGVIIGAPTYEGSLFPTMAAVLDMIDYKRIFNRTAAYFGSYGWGGGAMRRISTIFDKLNWNLIDSLEIAGGPGHEDLAKAEMLGENFGELVLSQKS